MLCTSTTEKECLERKLLGDRAWRLQYLREIKTGDIGQKTENFLKRYLSIQIRRKNDHN